jgi:hypothetical protein
VIQLVDALLEMRRTLPGLRGITPGGRDMTWIHLSDLGKSREIWPRSVLEVAIGKSDTIAAVPWTAVETISYMGEAGKDYLSMAARIKETLEVQQFFVTSNDECTIHWQSARWGGETEGSGTSLTIALLWEGKASWRRK